MGAYFKIKAFFFGGGMFVQTEHFVGPGLLLKKNKNKN